MFLENSIETNFRNEKNPQVRKEREGVYVKLKVKEEGIRKLERGKIQQKRSIIRDREFRIDKKIALILKKVFRSLRNILAVSLEIL